MVRLIGRLFIHVSLQLARGSGLRLGKGELTYTIADGTSPSHRHGTTNTVCQYFRATN